MKLIHLLKDNGMVISIEPDPHYNEKDIKEDIYMVEYIRNHKVDKVNKKLFYQLRDIRLWHNEEQEKIKNAKIIYK